MVEVFHSRSIWIYLTTQLTTDRSKYETEEYNSLNIEAEGISSKTYTHLVDSHTNNEHNSPNAYSHNYYPKKETDKVTTEQLIPLDGNSVQIVIDTSSINRIG